MFTEDMSTTHEITYSSTPFLLALVDVSTDTNVIRDAVDELNYRGWHLSAEGWYHRPVRRVS